MVKTFVNGDMLVQQFKMLCAVFTALFVLLSYAFDLFIHIEYGSRRLLLLRCLFRLTLGTIGQTHNLENIINLSGVLC